jgi:hypothetical protein
MNFSFDCPWAVRPWAVAGFDAVGIVHSFQVEAIS